MRSSICLRSQWPDFLPPELDHLFPVAQLGIDYQRSHGLNELPVAEDLWKENTSRPEIDSSRIEVRDLDLWPWDADHPVDAELVRAHAKQR